ncbi:G-protein coupled receptor 157 isoform X2 [Corvus cornix cornix]|uniref:G-protein coupled receptor 157 isoform X2 n=1 Tax=Corvus cornix cornix TaxID=932674 RepID=UPI0019518B37|nr:G-protein coupled receptor 157 isoform X2 [Corvus cornix cornix]
MTAGAGRAPPLPELLLRLLRSPSQPVPRLRTERSGHSGRALRALRTGHSGQRAPVTPAERSGHRGQGTPDRGLRSLRQSAPGTAGRALRQSAPGTADRALRSLRTERARPAGCIALSPRSSPLSPRSSPLSPRSSPLSPGSGRAMAAPLPPTPLFAAERGAVLVSCALSCVGSALLLCTHAQWPELRTRPRQLLLYLSLADLLSALSYFYGVLQDFERTSWDCVLQGALSTFANTSSFFWTMAIALYLYLTIVRGSPTGTGLLWCFHAVSWGVPLAITVAAVALKKIGYDASNVSVGWCWVNLDAEDRLLWMLLTGKVWEILAYVTLPVLYILIKKHINRAHAALSEYRPILPGAPALQPRTSIADKKLILIPVIFIFLRIWSTVRFILTLCNSPAVQNSVLVVLHGIGNTFQGGANCIMFVLCTRVVRARLLSLLCCGHCDELDWPVQGSNSSWQRPQPHKDKDVPGPEQTKPLLSST